MQSKSLEKAVIALGELGETPGSAGRTRCREKEEGACSSQWDKMSSCPWAGVEEPRGVPQEPLGGCPGFPAVPLVCVSLRGLGSGVRPPCSSVGQHT